MKEENESQIGDTSETSARAGVNASPETHGVSTRDAEDVVAPNPWMDNDRFWYLYDQITTNECMLTTESFDTITKLEDEGLVKREHTEAIKVASLQNELGMLREELAVLKAPGSVPLQVLIERMRYYLRMGVIDLVADPCQAAGIERARAERSAK